MKKSALLMSLCLAAAAPCAFADDTPSPEPTPETPGALKEIRAACDADIQKLCPDVKPGGGRILACLKQNKDAVSDGCKQALMTARKNRPPAS
jgi:hypothetical protein